MPAASPPASASDDSGGGASKDADQAKEVDASLPTLDQLRKEKILEDLRKQGKKEFEEERDSILARLPQDYKQMFHQIGFVKGRTDFLPCLILSPYEVSVGPVRSEWLERFHSVSTLRIDDGRWSLVVGLILAQY
jgi:hypothetical protein